MCIVCKKNNNARNNERKKGRIKREKHAAIPCTSLRSIKKGTYVCEVAIVAKQITSKSENEPTTSDFLCWTLAFDWTGRRESKCQARKSLTHDDHSKNTHILQRTRIHWIILQSFRMCLGRSICLHSSGLMATNYMSIICLPEHFANAHVFSNNFWHENCVYCDA